MIALPIGIAISRSTPSEAIDEMVRAEKDGVSSVWSTVAGTSPDAVTALAVAAARAQRIGLGTSVVPAYPRHPIVLAAQSLVIADLAPGRFRLGVGPSHRSTIEGMFGIPLVKPLVYMREYLTILRQLLWDGWSDFEGECFTVHAGIPRVTVPPRVPILMSALRANAYRLAGEISDGAISWVCPIPYLVQTALPALRSGAEAVDRQPPPLVAHVPVAVQEDRARVREAGHRFLGRYAQLPFYAAMFADAGYPIGPDNAPSEVLVDELVVSGSASEIVRRLREFLQTGISEILVTVLPVTDQDWE